jgi:hypothetical protein
LVVVRIAVPGTREEMLLAVPSLFNWVPYACCPREAAASSPPGGYAALRLIGLDARKLTLSAGEDLGEVLGEVTSAFSFCIHNHTVPKLVGLYEFLMNSEQITKKHRPLGKDLVHRELGVFCYHRVGMGRALAGSPSI